MDKEFHKLSENYVKITNSMEGISTEEIMDLSLIFLKSTRSILECGCKYDEMEAEWIYNECKKFIEIYKKLEK